MAAKHLTLKLGAQVMLLKKIDDELVNGSVGIIMGFATETDYGNKPDGPWSEIVEETGFDFSQLGSAERMETIWPIVRFQLFKQQRVEQVRWETFKNQLPDGKLLVSRQQIPLALAWALSIHKAQGQSKHDACVLS